MTAMTPTKVCTNCARALPLDAFYLDHRRGKHVARCKACDKAFSLGRRRDGSARPRRVQAFTNNARPARVCDRVGCGAPVADERWWSRHCSRACLLVCVGLPPAWEPAALDRATEAEVRAVLGAVFAAGRTDPLPAAGGAR